MTKRTIISKKTKPKIPRVLNHFSKQNSRIQKKRYQTIAEKIKLHKSKLLSQQKRRANIIEKSKKQALINERLREKKELNEFKRILYLNRLRQQQALLRGPPPISINDLSSSLHRLSTNKSNRRTVDLNSVIENNFWRSAPTIPYKLKTQPVIRSNIGMSLNKVPKRRFKPRTDLSRRGPH